MSGHADTIRPTIRHDKMRVVDTGAHPSTCPGCAAERSLDALLAENQRLREALEEICGMVPVDSLIDVRDAAREALRSEQ